MNANEKRIELIEKLAVTDDELLLDQVKAILEGTEVLIWDDLNPQLKESLARGLDQSRKGLGVEHEKAMKSFRARLQK